jgi:3-dehydroquinate synthase
LLADADVWAEALPRGDVLLITNTTVAPLYGPRVTAALGSRRVLEVDLPDGEAHKTLDTVSRVLDVLVANRFGRDAVIVALGGGVVGDTAGFAAACYQRGIAFVQAPTTLLAQVDSSVGGKTGVNHRGGKNLIGAFHQPVAVIADTAVLATLPARELSAGLAEVIKYGVIRDAAFFAWLEQNMDALRCLDTQALGYAVRRSCEIKADIVARDEREQGERALLNLGHTFGHAIEAATGYGQWLHGEAVGAGMLLAVDLAVRMQRCTADDARRVRALVECAGLPTAIGGLAAATLRDYMRIDKKTAAGRVRLVLPRGIGAADLVADYPDDSLAATLAAHFA